MNTLINSPAPYEIMTNTKMAMKKLAATLGNADQSSIAAVIENPTAFNNDIVIAAQTASLPRSFGSSEENSKRPSLMMESFSIFPGVEQLTRREASATGVVSYAFGNEQKSQFGIGSGVPETLWYAGSLNYFV